MLLMTSPYGVDADEAATRLMVSPTRAESLLRLAVRAGVARQELVSETDAAREIARGDSSCSRRAVVSASSPSACSTCLLRTSDSCWISSKSCETAARLNFGFSRRRRLPTTPSGCGHRSPRMRRDVERRFLQGAASAGPGNRKLDAERVREIKRRLGDGERVVVLAKEFRVGETTIAKSPAASAGGRCEWLGFICRHRWS